MSTGMLYLHDDDARDDDDASSKREVEVVELRGTHYFTILASVSYYLTLTLKAKIDYLENQLSLLKYRGIGLVRLENPSNLCFFNAGMIFLSRMKVFNNLNLNYYSYCLLELVLFS